MKILHVIPAIAERYGGPSQAIRCLCSSLSRLPNFEVHVATTDADGPAGVLPVNEIPADFRVFVFPRNWSERWKYSRQLSAWLKSQVREYQLVHLHALWSHAPAAAANAARRAGIPYIIRPAGMLSHYSFGHRRLLKSISWQLSEGRIVSNAAAFHATTPAEAEDIQRIRPEARVFVIPNGVNAEAFRVPPDRGYWRDRWFRNGVVRPVVVFLSRLHPKKGVIDLLLPAIASLNERPLTILAGGADDHDSAYAGQVAQHIAKLGLSDDVCQVGHVSGEKRWHLLDAADVFVLPSHSENFGIVVAEAMARGCPQIITDAVQISGHVQAGGSGVVVQRSVSDLARAISELSRNASLRVRMGQAGREYAATHFSWDGVARQVKDMYSEVLSETPSKMSTDRTMNAVRRTLSTL